MLEIIAALSALTWGSAATVLAVIVPTGGFLVVLLKMYFNNQQPGEIHAPDGGCDEVREHARKIVDITNEIDKLKLELEHLKDSVNTKDENIERQIEEMKTTIDKLTDMLINLLTNG